MARIYEDKEFVARLDKFLEDNRQNMVEDLKRLVAQKSVRMDPIPECMFGPDTYKALQLGKQIAQENKTQGVDAFCVDKFGSQGHTAEDQSTENHIKISFDQFTFVHEKTPL